MKRAPVGWWRALPISRHSDAAPGPQIGCMNILRDPETGFYNSMHALTTPTGRDTAVSLFVTPHSMQIIQKYIDMGLDEMPIAYVIGTPPAYEIMTNFSGLHLDSWGEAEMFGTIMGQDVEMVPCETIDLNVPANAEIVLEGEMSPTERHREAPFGEWPGYYASGERMEYVTTIHRVYHRHQPIMTGTPPAKPPTCPCRFSWAARCRATGTRPRTCRRRPWPRSWRGWMRPALRRPRAWTSPKRPPPGGERHPPQGQPGQPLVEDHRHGCQRLRRHRRRYRCRRWRESSWHSSTRSPSCARV